MLASVFFFGISSLAHASPAHEEAMRNSRHVLNTLQSVLPESIGEVIPKIESRELARVTPQYPIWIVEIINGTIVLYDGQPNMKGQPVEVLIDENGLAFGAQSVSFGKASRGGWLNLKLGASPAAAYCSSQYPFVVCTLISK